MQFKFKVALEAAKGDKTINQIASEHSLHPDQVSDWKKQLLEEGPTLFNHQISREQRNQASQEVEDLRKLEEQKQFSYLGVLTAGVAHKIGGKLGLMGFPIHELRQLAGKPGPEFDEVLTRLENQRSYLANLSKALLKPQGAKELPLEPVIVDQLLSEAMKAFQDSLVGVECVISGVEDLPPVRANKFLVEVFAELISNATEAMKDSSRKQLYITGNESITGKYVDIHFRDTGKGIMEEQMPYIFDLFYTSREGEDNGGYGLWMVKLVLSTFGGRIVAQSEGIEKGCTFVVSLPSFPNKV